MLPSVGLSVPRAGIAKSPTRTRYPTRARHTAADDSPTPSSTKKSRRRVVHGRAGTTHLDPQSAVEYIPHFLSPRAADALLADQSTAAHWSYRTITMFGRAVAEPRQKVLYGTRAYKYSGSLLHPAPGGWPSSVGEVARRVERRLGLAPQFFNACLGNKYADGGEYMGAHRDDEKELDSSVIASVSVGAERRFVVQPAGRGGADAPRYEWRLGHGSLLVMRGAGMQTHWKHQLPKDPKCQQCRLNFTFRHIYDTRKH